MAEIRPAMSHMTEADVAELDDEYDKVLGQLVRIITEPDKWTIR